MELDNRTVAIGIVTSVTSLAVGSVAGYFVAKKKLESKYEEIAAKQIAEARLRYKLLAKKGEYADPANLVKPAEEEPSDEEEHLPILNEAVTAVIQQYDPSRQFARNGDNPGKDGSHLAVETPRTRNIFEEPDMADDEESEEQYEVPGEREDGRPFIIDFATFDSGDQGYQNITLTHYADGALVEEGDRTEELTIVEDLIGVDNLQHMGWERGQANVLYVRNPRRRTDFEVIQDERRFGADILGLGEDSEFLDKVQELARPRSAPPNQSPRSRFSNYTPGG